MVGVRRRDGLNRHQPASPHSPTESDQVSFSKSILYQHNEFHTLVKHLRMPNVHRISFCGESHPVCGLGINPTFRAPHLFDGLPSFPIFEWPIERVFIRTREGSEFVLSLTAKGGFVLYALLSWVADAVPLFDGYVERSIKELAKIMALAPQAHVQLHHLYLVPSDLPVYQPFLLVSDIDRLTIRGGFAADILYRLTAHSDHTPLLPHLSRLNIMDRGPLAAGVRETLVSCLRSRKDLCFTVRVVDEELPCAAYNDLGFTVKQSKDEVEKSVEPSGFTTPEEDTDALLARLCREGGVELQNLLISKAVSPTANEKTPKEWKYRDIATLPQAELEEWRTACNEELEALRRRKVYDLVERPRGRKVIKNRWVFDQKPAAAAQNL
ncbi:hypothetical protein BJ322DRAFT_1112997 [Thelephora terrestris]|uniref:Uncharacterized protein n=1 Tax=Thelephora terrestris TaxID=56493 RepID=A0A9P6H5J6_9AGAM|nr:hypothetical protein BJ322DRAFT_1112997 [Thelephora terrestris]